MPEMWRGEALKFHLIAMSHYAADHSSTIFLCQYLQGLRTSPTPELVGAPLHSEESLVTKIAGMGAQDYLQNWD